jgi:hypothetical protein
MKIQEKYKFEEIQNWLKFNIFVSGFWPRPTKKCIKSGKKCKIQECKLKILLYSIFQNLIWYIFKLRQEKYMLSASLCGWPHM